MMQMCLDGETVLVTGASRGIGSAIAGAMLASGARVIGTATSEQGRAQIEHKWQSVDADNQLQAHVLDVADPGSIGRLFEQLSAANLTPSVVVNNAGITRDGLLARMSEDDWDAVVNTNLGGVFRVCKAAMRSMMKARHGRIINITSVVGVSGNAGQCNYAASKAGLIGFSRSLARELAPRGVTVNCVAPGFIDTDMTESLGEAIREQLTSQIPLKRMGTAEEVAGAVVFLASAAGAYITGETLHINGGMLMS